MSTVKEICRFICGLLDSIAFEIISLIYNLFYEVANLILYSQDMFKAIGQRIGLILGIFMLFRLAISLVSYLISPDKIKDNAKGGGKMLINVIVSLTLLATVNVIFVQAYKLQTKVVDSKIIEKIFFGEQASIPEVDIAYVLYSGFLTPNVNVLPGCERLFDAYLPLEDRCANSLQNANISGDAKNVILNDVLKKHDFNKIFTQYDLLNAKFNGEFIFDYMPIISTIVAIIVILILISFCMDLATRAVKLLFLQIIAPIPIIANIDPGKGSEIFKKWYKECISTYVSIFIRIISINFAVFMITLITVNFSDIFQGKSVFLTILIIIGCLMFAKQVPKLIEDMLGIKMDGMSLNPLKKFEEQALFGKNITGLAAGATVGTIGAAVGGPRMWAQGVKGAFGGLFSGKGFNETWKNQISNNLKMRGALAEGSTFWGRRAAQISGALGIQTPSENLEAEAHRIDEEIKDIDNEMKPLNDSISDRTAFTDKAKAMEDRARQKIKDGEAGLLSQQYLSMVNYTENLREQLKRGVAGVTEQQVAQAEMRINHYLNEVATYEYIDYTTGLSNDVSNYNVDGTNAGTTTNRAALVGATAIKDGYMNSMNDDLVAMTRNATTYEYTDATGVTRNVTIDASAVTSGAANRHNISNDVSGSVNADKRTKVASYNNRKQILEQEKAELYEKQRTAKANQSAVSGK